MNKKIIKIGVPILVLVIIVIIIAVTQKNINPLDGQRIESQEFETYVGQYIADSISGQTLANAQRGYQTIYDIIETETTISAKTSSGSTTLLSAAEADDCYKRIFDSYYTIYEQTANRLFSSSTWNANELKEIRNDANDLLKRQGTSAKKDSLNNYVKYVNGYYSAKGLLNKSKHCTNLNSYQNLCNEAKKYKKYPYTNNSELKNIQRTVSSQAKGSWKRHLDKEVSNLCGMDNTSFNDNFSRVNAAIKEYESKFGNESCSDWNDKMYNRYFSKP